MICYNLDVDDWLNYYFLFYLGNVVVNMVSSVSLYGWVIIINLIVEEKVVWVNLE